MSSVDVYGTCQACNVPLSDTQFAIALQHHTIAYTLEGDTPDDQAYLEISSMATAASFCSDACCMGQLPKVLENNGIPASHAQIQIFGGPIHLCAKCDAMVNLTQPHGAWAKLKRTVEIVDGELAGYPEWFDVHAVICVACTELQKEAALARIFSERL